ncbi:MAG: CtsR family transcriptional regulator, partial [Eubacteriales bacterium]|nr:CtsR family transcriptional regulator [Eubacteriales bacterium]
GYLIESRRGGGGFVRIVRLQMSGADNLLSALLGRVGTAIAEDTARAIIAQIEDGELVTPGEASLMRAAVSKSALALPISAKDVLRAAVLSSMLKQVFRNLEGEDSDDLR